MSKIFKKLFTAITKAQKNPHFKSTYLAPKCEWVWVRDKDRDDQERRILLTDLGEGVVSRHICVHGGYEDDYTSGEKCIYESWSQMSLVNPSVREEIKERIKILKGVL